MEKWEKLFHKLRLFFQAKFFNYVRIITPVFINVTRDNPRMYTPKAPLHTQTNTHTYAHTNVHMHAHVYTMLTWVCAHSLHHTSYTPVHRYIHASIHKGTCNCPHALYTQTAHPHTSTHTHAHHTCAQRHAHDVCTIYAHTSA